MKEIRMVKDYEWVIERQILAFRGVYIPFRAYGIHFDIRAEQLHVGTTFLMLTIFVAH